jgi:hypothetical protein
LEHSSTQEECSPNHTSIQANQSDAQWPCNETAEKYRSYISAVMIEPFSGHSVHKGHDRVNDDVRDYAEGSPNSTASGKSE